MKLPVMKVLRALLLSAGVLGSAALVSCGGGDRVEDFDPKRLLVFGDENSVIDDSASAGNGRKYTVNGLVADSAGNLTSELDCVANPIWVQYVAGTFGRTSESIVVRACMTRRYSISASWRRRARTYSSPSRTGRRPPPSCARRARPRSCRVASRRTAARATLCS